MFCQVIKREQYSNRDNLIFTTATCIVICLLAILFPNVKPVISILGGLFSIQMAYFFPIVIQINLSAKRWFEWENLKAILLLGPLVFFGYGSVVITIVELITGKDEMPRWKP